MGNYSLYFLISLIALTICISLQMNLSVNAQVQNIMQSTNQTQSTNQGVNISCKALALTLITWDEFYYDVAEHDLIENEQALADVNIHPNTYQDIIDPYLIQLVDDYRQNCKDQVEEEIDEIFEEDVDFNRPNIVH